MSLSDTLSVVQSLYEKGFVTYPRTNTEYLAEAEKDKISKILSLLKNKGYSVEFKDKKSIFDDTKIESHSALTPTLKLPDTDDLSAQEQNVYNEILNRFLAVFCSVPCEVDRTTIIVSVGDYEDFTLKGDIYVRKGFLMYDAREIKDKVLPELAEGDIVNIRFVPKEKKTTPPKPYTTETLNNYLKNPFRDKKECTPEDEYKAVFEGLELGTEATRAGIIDNALKSRYISLKNNVYHIDDKGRFLIQAAAKLDIIMDKQKTAELGAALKRVYRGEISVAECVRIAECEITEIFQNQSSAEEINTYQEASEIIGKCPRCGSDVTERKKGFFCCNRDCGFALWKDDKYFKAIGKKLTQAAVKSFLSKGCVKLKGLTSRKGTKYDAVIRADFTGQYPKYTMEFPKNKGRR